MKILHFYKTSVLDSIGGVEQFIDQIASHAHKNYGLVSEVLTLSPKPSPSRVEINGYVIHRAKLDMQIASTSFSISAFKKFKELAKTADIIHYHFPWPFMDLVHFISNAKKPTIVTYHSDIIRQKYLLKIYLPLMNIFLSSVSKIVATSPNYLATSEVLSKYRDKVSVIPIGLDKNSIALPSTEKQAYWRNRFGKKFFLFVGVIRYYKGLHILLDAAKDTEYPIVILGAGPIEEKLKLHAARLGLNNVFFLGRLPQEDKVALQMQCYCVLFPSHLRSEAFGISLLEGAMFGKPLISSEIGTGTTFINITGETGLVVPPSDPLALRQAMQSLWNNPDMATQMGKRAEARYWELFTADKMVESYVDMYRQLIREAG
jgi:glycosyltransferase involved in cell wall biosynthesis